jgi:NAD(P)-dependent dehydrogenase (short-subunit alcohol dehydrogenase family)
MYNPYSLSGKRILVTGASSGIGRTTAIECSKLGATLVVTGRNEQRLKETLSLLEGVDHSMIIADITVEEELQRLVKALPKLDGVVLSAGVGSTFPLKFASRRKIDSMFETNFYSTVELLRQIQKSKLLNKGASVVAVSSIAAFQSDLGNGVYGASKAALLTWMRYMAREMAPTVRVNCVCPGMTDTPLIHDGAISEEQIAEDALRHPLKRHGKPEDIAFGIIYLLSDAAAWVTGIALTIDGGISIS